jgi:site-specific DNA-methyltransferase (adenine-specific)
VGGGAVNKVHLIDCMEFMADVLDNHYELAIVDPPYGIGETLHSKKHKDFTWNNSYPEYKYFYELYRISENQIIWGANYYINQIKHPARIIWNKLGTNTERRKTTAFMSDCEIASYSKNYNVKMFSYTWIGNVRGNNYQVVWNDSEKIHPQQKPIALYKWLLKNYAKPGDKIFDSHVGSGSIRIACHDLGFDFEGCEIDEDYWKAQEERYKNHIAQCELFEIRGGEVI